MATTNRVRVFIATSLDGFIAGPDDDLGWLEAPPAGVDSLPPSPDALDYDGFMAEVGALLMGRRTYEVVRSFDVPWPYGDRPVLVASSRPLGAGRPPTVRRVEGTIGEMVALAKHAAAGRDVYLDGGVLIRQAAEEGLIDELTVTVAPIALGSGRPLFAGMRSRYPMRVVSHHTYAGGMVQMRLVPR